MDTLNTTTTPAPKAASQVPVAYADLERVSRNHLRAFTCQLDSQRVAYELTRLDPSGFETIASSETDRGHDA